jgi:hypothetical protein
MLGPPTVELVKQTLRIDAPTAPEHLIFRESRDSFFAQNPPYNLTAIIG